MQVVTPRQSSLIVISNKENHRLCILEILVT